jgi:hypothetical protein
LETFQPESTWQDLYCKNDAYSQVNYLRYFLGIPQNISMRLSGMINNFVRGDTNLASKRLHLPSNMGGFGLFELDTFLAAKNVPGFHAPFFYLNEKWK